MRKRYRVVLPVIFGLITLGLIAWEIYNEHVVMQMGMAWDTGAPIWPYQTSSLILSALNSPAVVLSAPLFFVLNLRTFDARIPTIFVVSILWWWWIGTRIDFGVLGRHHYRHPKLAASILLIAAIALVCAGVIGLRDEFRWWRNYGHQLEPAYLLLLLRMLGPACWAFVIAVGCSWASLRLVQGRFNSAPVVHGEKHRLLGVSLAVIALIQVAIALLSNTPTEIVDPDSCIADRATGCIHGTIADDAGTPVNGLMVEAFKADKNRDERWISKVLEWTDASGRYSFNRLEPGTYLVVIHYFDAPDASHPFATTFYPGVESEDDAHTIEVTAQKRSLMEQFRVRSLPLTTIQVEVMWPDGTRPRWSNLLFHNNGYPSQAVIGDVAPGVVNGQGQFTLPVGFDYDVRAAVNCDTGTKIESRESTPPHRVDITGTEHPDRLTFVLPGPACTLWRPK